MNASEKKFNLLIGDIPPRTAVSVEVPLVEITKSIINDIARPDRSPETTTTILAPRLKYVCLDCRFVTNHVDLMTDHQAHADWKHKLKRLFPHGWFLR